MITVNWEDDTYVVKQDEEFIYDTTDLHDALYFALQVGGAVVASVVVASLGPGA